MGSTIIISDPMSEMTHIYGGFKPSYYKTKEGSKFLKLNNPNGYIQVAFIKGIYYKETCVGDIERFHKRIEQGDLVKATAEEFAEMESEYYLQKNKGIDLDLD